MFRKTINTIKSAQGKCELAILGVAATATAFATSADTKEGAAFQHLASGVQDIVQGEFGNAISIIAFLTGLFMMMATGHKLMAFIIGAAVPLSIQFGPSIFMGLSGAGVVV